MDLAKTFSKVRKAAVGLTTSTGRNALRMGVAATLEHRDLLRDLSPAVVIDVGANRGQFALDVIAASPRSRIISFEPLPEAIEAFQHVVGHLGNVELRECALGSEAGSLLLNVSESDDSSSLLPIGPRQVEAFPGTAAAGTVEVRVSTLDQEMESVDLGETALLKLDVQGFEAEVLRGGGEVLDRFRWIYAECSFDEFYEGQALAHEVIAVLAGSGFGLTRIVATTQVSGRIVQADLLFEPIPV